MKGSISVILLLGGILTISIFLLKSRSQELPPAEDQVVFDSTAIQRTLDSFDRFLRQRLDSMGSVGAATTVFHGDSVVYTLTYGLRRAGTTDSVDRNTVFRLASVSKGFAGVLLCQLHQKRRLKLDDKVTRYLRDFRLKDSVNTHDMSIRHLLNHTSGLVPHAYDNLVEAGQSVEEILPRLVEVDISAPPGRLYGYQNVMFSLVDTIATLATRKSYSELLEQHIFSPLGMGNSSSGYGSLVWNPNVAFPHIRSKGEFHPLPLHTGYYNLLPAAGVNASIKDIGKWLGALLGNNPRAIHPNVLKKISTPEIETPLRRAYTRRWDPIDGRYYSLGWRVFDYKGYRIIYHGGYVRGYRAEIAFCPQLQTGLAFLQNSPNGVASHCVPTFFNTYFRELAD
jgi:beta-lactamase class C